MAEQDSASLIKSAIPLSHYIGRFTDKPLKGTNGKFRTACCIHNGSNPSSLSINDELGAWKCWTDSCGGGSIIDFWMAYNDNSDFGEAVEALAKELSVKLPEYTSNKVSKRRITDALGLLAEEATDYLFTGQDEECKEMRRYLKARGVKKSMAVEWGIGFIPSMDNGAEDFVLDCSTDVKALVEGGAIKDQSNGYWVPMHGRLVFSVFNEHGDVIGFSARKIDSIKSSGAGKYINGSETPVYHKSEVLYGMHNVDKSTKHAFVCEGPLDTIAVSRVIDENSVAVSVCGTAFTKDHLEFLSKMKTVTFLFDGDDPGREAVLKTTWTLNGLKDRAQGVVLESDTDPYEIYLDDPDNLYDIMETAEPLASMVASTKWALCDHDEVAMKDWVRKTVPTINFTHHREQIISDAARLIGQNASSFKRELTFPSKNDVASLSANGDPGIISPNTRALCSALVRMDTEERMAVLAPFMHWDDRCERAIHNWMPVSTEIDVAVIKKLALGIDSPSNAMMDRAMASLLAFDDEDDICGIIGAMCRNIMYGMSSMDLSDEHFIAEQIPNIKRASLAASRPECHPMVLSYLIDTSIGLERITEKAEKAERHLQAV